MCGSPDVGSIVACGAVAVSWGDGVLDRPVRRPYQAPSPAAALLGSLRSASAACRRAFFRACLSARRSRSAVSRFSFAIVVFFFLFDPMRVLVSSGGVDRLDERSSRARDRLSRSCSGRAVERAAKARAKTAEAFDGPAGDSA
jgi:hypothetical protein